MATLEDILEGVLLAAAVPLAIRDIAHILSPHWGALADKEIEQHLHKLADNWQNKTLCLKKTASGWRFYTREILKPYLHILYAEKPPKYSRATLETLAIIVHQQPVTRSDIEAIRGVSVSSQIIKSLEDRGWIEVIGQREIPGRPNLYATTRQFLDDMGLSGLDELPPFMMDKEENLDV